MKTIFGLWSTFTAGYLTLTLATLVKNLMMCHSTWRSGTKIRWISSWNNKDELSEPLLYTQGYERHICLGCPSPCGMFGGLRLAIRRQTCRNPTCYTKRIQENIKQLVTTYCEARPAIVLLGFQVSVRRSQEAWDWSKKKRHQNTT
jgi:hypothetical protein